MIVVAVIVAAIALHEIAHAVVARLVGHQLFEIEIGTGPRVVARVGGVRIRLGALPLGGSVLTGSPDPQGFRWRAVAVAAAGPTANLILAGVCALSGIGAGVVFNVVAAGANLWPGGRRQLGVASSDGRVVFDLVRGNSRALAEERSSWWVAHALEHQRGGRTALARDTVDDGLAELGPTPSLLAVAGLVAVSEQRFADAVHAYAPLIDDPSVAVAARAGVAADAAWAACLSGDDALAALARPWAALATGVEPRDQRRRMVHALAVLDSGDPAQARAEAVGIGGPSAAAVEVLALAAEGDREAACRRFDDGVQGRLAPGHPLLRRVEDALGI